MAWQFTANVLIPVSSDKVGKIWIMLKDALLATGRWRLIGSGDGKSAFQLRGQTAGVAGSFDVFTKSPQWATNGPSFDAWPNSFSNRNAWYLLEEIASSRILLVQRGSSSTSSDFTSKAGNAVATTGATAVLPPAFVGPSGTLGALVSFGNEFAWNDTREHWLQIGADDSVRPGNVSPWFFSIWSRTNNIRMGGGLWAALVDLDPAVTNNVAAAAGAWTDVFGIPGNADGACRGTTSAWRGGSAWDVCSFSYLTNTGVGAAPPTYQQIGTDNKYRTQRPWILHPTLGSRHIGRLDDFYMNKLAREYPSTYDLAGAQPRLTLGHLIVPWTNALPSSSP